MLAEFGVLFGVLMGGVVLPLCLLLWGGEIVVKWWWKVTGRE